MKIGRSEYVLSPRRAADVYDLAAAVETYDEKESAGRNMLVAAQIVSDSLKATGLSLGWRALRYRRFVKRSGVSFLMASLTDAELWLTYTEVLRLEGEEKKRLLTEVESESGAKSPVE